MKRFLFGTDSHGDQIDPEAARAFLEFAEDFKPHVKIHGGDFLDLRPIRRGASNEEQAENMLDDVESGIMFLKQYFKGSGERVLTLGNHDHRLWELSESSVAGLKAEYAFSLRQRLEKILDRLRVDYRPYCVRRGRYQLGNLSFVHGFHHNIHCAKTHAEKFGSVIFGHVHRFSESTVAHVDHIVGMSCGSLAKTDMPYTHKMTSSLAHENGWIFGIVNEKTGNWEAWKVRQTEDGRWLNPRTI